MKKSICFFIFLLLHITNLAFSLEEVDFPLLLKDNSVQIDRLFKRIEDIRSRSMGWCSKEKAKAIATIILNTKPKVCAEVGVFGGSSFFPIALAAQHVHKDAIIYAIDSWNNKDCIEFMPDYDLNKAWWSIVDLNLAFLDFKNILTAEELEKLCVLLKENSILAANRIEDESIEFLHLDGNHSFLGAQMEVHTYLPKVKSGGYILVNDVMWGVGNTNPILNAIDELFNECELIDSFDNDNIYLFRKL
jgi:hypothetical protein